MSTVVRCDRCHDEGCQVVQVLGSDLCNRCIGEHHVWVAAGVNVSTRTRRMPNGDWWRAIEMLLHRDGHATPDSLAVATGAPRAKAHWALRWAKGQGKLDQKGRVRFIPKQEAAE